MHLLERMLHAFCAAVAVTTHHSTRNPRNVEPVDKRALLQEGRTENWACLTSPFAPQGKLADAVWPAGGVFLDTVPYKLCDTSNDLGAVLDQWGNVDCWNFQWLAAFALPGGHSHGLFVDAGMNVGTCSMLALALGHRVVAFEPNHAAIVGALLSAEANGPGALERLEVHEQLVSDGSDAAAVFQCKSTKAAPCEIPYQVVKLAGCVSGKALPGGGGEDAVPSELLARFPGKTFIPMLQTCRQTVRLDHVVDEFITVLKMDVDGSEMPALRGARALFLARKVGVLHIELVESEMESIGVSFADVRALVEGEYGYTMFAMVACPTCEDGSVTTGTANACATRLDASNAWLRKGFERQYQQHDWNDMEGGSPIACPAGQCLAMGHALIPVDQFEGGPWEGGANYLFAAVSPMLVERAQEAAKETLTRCLPGRWSKEGRRGLAARVVRGAAAVAASMTTLNGGRDFVLAAAFVVLALVGWKVVAGSARVPRSRQSPTTG